MIHRLPIMTTHNAPVNKIKTSTPQNVPCKNLLSSCNPSKERDTRRSLNLPNTFPRKDNRQGISELIIERANVKIPLLRQSNSHSTTINQTQPNVLTDQVGAQSDEMEFLGKVESRENPVGCLGVRPQYTSLGEGPSLRGQFRLFQRFELCVGEFWTVQRLLERPLLELHGVQTHNM